MPEEVMTGELLDDPDGFDEPYPDIPQPGTREYEQLRRDLEQLGGGQIWMQRTD